ncbi:MAG: 3-phosphoglycerate dehydrogenase, partial [Flavobacteriales bacterium]|nr:3-phosphoglycerate dehydrogenase [Flavobacteriales bacterium]
MRIHANDGIAPAAVDALKNEGFRVTTDHVGQDLLAEHIQREGIEVLLVRSATKVRKDLIDACPGLRMIGRGGVGLDNIDVDHAISKGIEVINTPAASSISVA